MEEKKKSKLKIIIPIVAVIVIVTVAVIVVTANKKECEKLEEEWKNKPEIAGNLCINVGYYTQLVKDHVNSTGRTMTEVNENRKELETLKKQIDEQAEQLEELGKTLGKRKTEAQEKFFEMYSAAMDLYKKAENVSNKFTGYSLMLNMGGAKTSTVLEACEEVLQKYDNDIKYKLVYSANDETLTERKKYFEPKIVNQKRKQEIMNKYFGY